MQTRSKERTGAGGSFNWGASKAEIRNAAATTSRCVGSDKVASRSCDRPAINAVSNPLASPARGCVMVDYRVLFFNNLVNSYGWLLHLKRSSRYLLITKFSIAAFIC